MATVFDANVINLGNSVKLWWLTSAPEFVRDGGAGLLDVEGGHKLVGALLQHRRANRQLCGATVSFVKHTNLGDAPESEQAPVWSLDSTDPVTISPVIDCPHCDFKGSVTNGAWMPA